MDHDKSEKSTSAKHKTTIIAQQMWVRCWFPLKPTPKMVPSRKRTTTEFHRQIGKSRISSFPFLPSKNKAQNGTFKKPHMQSHPNPSGRLKLGKETCRCSLNTCKNMCSKRDRIQNNWLDPCPCFLVFSYEHLKKHVLKERGRSHPPAPSRRKTKPTRLTGIRSGFSGSKRQPQKIRAPKVPYLSWCGPGATEGHPFDGRKGGRGKNSKRGIQRILLLLFFLHQQHNKQKTQSRTTSKQNK